jgi:RNA polymerase sigma-70 factor (subfamily 1)
MSDLEQTVASASHGDAAALDQLFARHLPQLRAFIRLRMGPELRARESASDIVQSACREVLAHLERYRYQGDAQFRHWLFTTVQRKLSNKVAFHRAARRDVRRQAELAGAAGDTDWHDIGPTYADVLTPSRQAMDREKLARLEAAFDALSPEHREVITLARIVGLPHCEIAVAMGRSEAACRTLLYRATAQLAVLLGEE